METHISSKGQITLPVAVRRKLGLKTGDVLAVRVTPEGKVVLEAKEKAAKEEGKEAQAALNILRETAGLWKEMRESGAAFTRRLRRKDNKRWKELGLE